MFELELVISRWRGVGTSKLNMGLADMAKPNGEKTGREMYD